MIPVLLGVLFRRRAFFVRAIQVAARSVRQRNVCDVVHSWYRVTVESCNVAHFVPFGQSVDEHVMIVLCEREILQVVNNVVPREISGERRWVVVVSAAGSAVQLRRVLLLVTATRPQLRRVLLLVSAAVAQQGWLVKFARTVVAGHIFFLYLYIR